MKKILNIFMIFIVLIIFLNTFNMNLSMATINTSTYKPVQTIETSNDTLAIAIANRVIGAFQAIGSIASVLILVIIGIKYMMGSVEQKAEYKKTATNYIIGAILLFAISNISAMLYNFAKGLST